MDVHVNKATNRFAYRIEEKPEGGFVARSDDPTMEAVEGATREEVIKKLEGLLLIKAGLPQGLSGGVTKLLDGVKFNVNVTKTVAVKNLNPGEPLSGEEQKILAQFTGTQAQPAQPQMMTDFQSELGKSSSDTMGTILRVVAALIAVGAIVYAIFLRR